MKKSFFGLIAIAFISLSSFTTKSTDELVLHNCTYNMYNASGQFLGQLTLYDVPDNVSCGSSKAKQVAIDYWNGTH